ncbi:MAG: hypothetical protein HN337_06350 [Deltaproteobacteria bacterium]|nr:hypothetical protein [Deltaproteobacteria bacterium]
MKNYAAVVFLLISLVFLGGCGGAGGTPPSSIPVALEGVDGASGVAVNSSFLYTFDFEVDTSTVTTSTYFIVPTIATDVNLAVEKSEYSSSVCDVSRALASTVTCDSNTECLLDPTENLNEGTSYTACLTSEILKATGEAITPVAITFVTEAGEFAIAGVLDGRGVPISTSSTTGVDFNSITIMFTEVPSGDADSTDLRCDEAGSGEIAYDAEISGSRFILTATDAYRYQLMNCTLTIASGVTNPDGDSLAGDAAYSFTNGCAVNDDFNVDSQSCWYVAPDTDNSPWATWDELLANVLTFDTSSGAISFSDASTSSDLDIVLEKTVNVDSTGFSLELFINNATGVDDASISNADDGAGLSMGSYEDGSDGYLEVYLDYDSGELRRECQIQYENENTGLESEYTLPCPEGSEYYLLFSVGASGVLAQSSTDGVNYTDLQLTSGSNPFPDYQEIIDSFGDSSFVGFGFDSANGGDMRVSIGSIVTTGMTSDDQY